MLQGNSTDAAEHLPGKETGVGLNTGVSCSSECLMGEGRLRNLSSFMTVSPGKCCVVKALHVKATHSLRKGVKRSNKS